MGDDGRTRRPEDQLETGFNRFCDLTFLEGILLSSAEVLHLAIRRSAFNPNDIRVKSAILATEPLALAIARMYEQLLNSPRIEVRVFSELETAATWLTVKQDSLTIRSIGLGWSGPRVKLKTNRMGARRRSWASPKREESS